MDLLHDWRLVVFLGTMMFQIGMAWSQAKGTRRDLDGLRSDVADLKRRVLNGITTALQSHGEKLSAIEARCEARRGDGR